MEYGYAEKRKTKRDKKAKVRYGRYKRGGRHRVTEIKLTGDKKKVKSK